MPVKTPKALPKDYNQIIRELIAEGHRVYSHALGRVGEVMSVDDNPIVPVEICRHSRSGWPQAVKSHKHIHGATTFNAGDPVYMEKRGDDFFVINRGLK